MIYKSSDLIRSIASQIEMLTADEIWELARELNDNHTVLANILRADLEIAEFQN